MSMMKNKQIKKDILLLLALIFINYNICIINH